MLGPFASVRFHHRILNVCELDYFSYALRDVIPKFKKTAVVWDTLAGARDGWGPTGVTGWVAERTQTKVGCPEHCVETGWGQRRWCWGILD